MDTLSRQALGQRLHSTETLTTTALGVTLTEKRLDDQPWWRNMTTGPVLHWIERTLDAGLLPDPVDCPVDIALEENDSMSSYLHPTSGLEMTAADWEELYEALAPHQNLRMDQIEGGYYGDLTELAPHVVFTGWTDIPHDWQLPDSVHVVEWIDCARDGMAHDPDAVCRYPSARVVYGMSTMLDCVEEYHARYIFWATNSLQKMRISATVVHTQREHWHGGVSPVQRTDLDRPLDVYMEAELLVIHSTGEQIDEEVVFRELAGSSSVPPSTVGIIALVVGVNLPVILLRDPTAPSGYRRKRSGEVTEYDCYQGRMYTGRATMVYSRGLPAIGYLPIIQLAGHRGWGMYLRSQLADQKKVRPISKKKLYGRR